nr:response regulator [uncultured Pseudogulbenkiania sp.]
MNILIVDDDCSRQSELARHLSSCIEIGAINITTVDNVDEAKRLLRGVYFDALILDVVLPKKKDSSANFSNGIGLLSQISRSPSLKKPEKIIGITAHLDDISSFREEFEKYCHTIVEAQQGHGAWKSKISSALSYAFKARVDRSGSDSTIYALTIHGIRTFGSWQSRLKTIAERTSSSIEVGSYKYGYFSIVAFYIPFLRWIEVRRLTMHLKSLFSEHADKQFVFYTHSFGTYLLAKSLNVVLLEENIPNIATIVFSGSVLRSNYSLRPILDKTNARIVNECGDSDYVLWISEAIVPFVGMAGKTGFYGINDDRFINRFFNGGHSLYFTSDGFMEKYWAPLLDRASNIESVDMRGDNFLHYELLEKMISSIGFLKEILMASILIWIFIF